MQKAQVSRLGNTFSQGIGISFTEAGTVLGDELAITVPDPDHSKEEDRHITMDGQIAAGY